MMTCTQEVPTVLELLDNKAMPWGSDSKTVELKLGDSSDLERQVKHAHIYEYAQTTKNRQLL
jgi:hypothetical protein